MIKKSIYRVGERVRSPEIREKYHFLKQTEYWSKKQLEEYQLKELKKLVNHAYQTSSFYKNLYDSNNFDPMTLNSLEDIKNIPLVTKKELLKNINDIQNKEGYRKLFFSETSGSTGEPLAFHRDSNWDAGHRAAQLRGYSWYNVRPWDYNGYFWGYNLDNQQAKKIKLLDFLMNRFRLFSYNDSEIDLFLHKLEKADYVEGYSSMIYEIAKKINQKEIKFDNLKMIKGTSEKIYDSYQDEVYEAFGKKMISEYGAMETGIIAFECPNEKMHVTMENVVVEEIEGEAVITNLLSNSFPIIRYQIGDSIILDKEIECECGMKHDVIVDVLGRIGTPIVGIKQKYPSLTLYYIFKNIVLNHNKTINYQAIQNNKGELDIYLDVGLDVETKKIIENECYKYFGTDLVLVLHAESLERDYDKKFRDFISKI